MRALRAMLWFLGLGASLISCAHEVSQQDLQSARINYDAGVDYLSKGQMTPALSALLNSEKLDPSFPDLHNALGITYMAIGKLDEAEQHLRKAIELKPGWSEARNNLGTVLMQRKNYEGAIVEFKAALSDVLYPTPSHAEGNLGWALYMRGERTAGLKHIKNATLVNPKFCRGYLWLGQIYQEGQEWRDAERYLDRFVERCLLDNQIRTQVDASIASEAYMRLGQVEVASGNKPRAKVAFESCVRAGEDTPYFDTCDKQLRTIE